MKPTAPILPVEEISPLIKTIRNQRVILDSDLALIYGVETKMLNRAIKRNADRFPAEFVFVLEPNEIAALRCQFGTLKPGRGQHRKYPTFAFTEYGALMACSVLNTPRAVAMSIYIIRAFVKMREEHAANAAILKRLAEIDKTLLIHDAGLRDIYQKLRPLLAPPPEQLKPEIGFHVKEDAAPYRTRRKTIRPS